MKLKERIDLISKLNNSNENETEIKSADKLSSGKLIINTKSYLSGILNEDKSIILICEGDKSEIIKYISGITDCLKMERISGIDELKKSEEKRILIEEVSNYDAAKLMELIISSKKQVIFPLELKSKKDIIGGIKLLIMLNHPNISEKQAELLIGLSGCSILTINKDNQITQRTDTDYKGRLISEQTDTEEESAELKEETNEDEINTELNEGDEEKEGKEEKEIQAEQEETDNKEEIKTLNKLARIKMARKQRKEQ